MPQNIRFFEKVPQTSEQQIELLRSRGLIVANEDIAKHYLDHIGYYRLSAYMRPLQIEGDKSHRFISEKTFEDIVYLYDFDRNLRLLTANAIEKIEISIKSTVCNTICLTGDATWYAKPEIFGEARNHRKILGEILGAIEFGLPSEQIKNQSIEHYYKTYDYPFYPPAWMVFETLSFGTVERLFMHLKESYKNDISKKYNLHSPVMWSWLQSLNYTRNLCAHHQRLWNRTFTIKPKQPDKKLQGELSPNNKFYAQAVVMQFLMREISPDTKWADRLLSLLKEYPEINVAQMGFPTNWTEREIWNY
jgi:abortive infection bacteriophage resistance protein